MGRGPSTASQAARDKRAQCKRAKEYVQSFKENNFTIGDGEDVSFQQRRLSTRHLILLVPVTQVKLPFHQGLQVQLILHSLPISQE